MDQNFRDLPCQRIEMDEQWQYVGAHAGRLAKDDQTERGDYWRTLYDIYCLMSSAYGV